MMEGVLKTFRAHLRSFNALHTEALSILRDVHSHLQEDGSLDVFLNDTKKSDNSLKVISDLRDEFKQMMKIMSRLRSRVRDNNDNDNNNGE